jgi:hypothetical protein
MSSLRQQVHGVRAPSVNSSSSLNGGLSSSRQGLVRNSSHLKRDSRL